MASSTHGSTRSAAIWIKNPRACWTGNSQDASNGLVIQGNNIIELVAAGKSPDSVYDYSFDASDHVVLPGLINCHRRTQQRIISLAASALSGLVKFK
jgi:8-oxoguanine deaminase